MANEMIDTSDGEIPGELKKPAGMKRANQVAAIILFLFSVFITIEALAWPLSNKYGPGPGLFPFGLGILLAILSISLFIEASSSKKKDKPSPFPDNTGLKSVGLVVVGLIGFALLIIYLGYVLAALIFVLFIMGCTTRQY